MVKPQKGFKDIETPKQVKLNKLNIKELQTNID